MWVVNCKNKYGLNMFYIQIGDKVFVIFYKKLYKEIRYSLGINILYKNT